MYKKDTAIGFYDTTLIGSGKSGYVFTDTKVCYKELLERLKKIWNDDIKNVELFDTRIFRGRISGKQLFKNFVNTITSVTGEIGGLIGSIGCGATAGKAKGKVLGSFIEDDAELIVKIIHKVFDEMVAEYLLNEKEAEKTCWQTRRKTWR